VNGIPCTLNGMTSTPTGIPDKVRGVAAEKRYSQERIARTLGISRTSVVERFNGRVPFTAEELLTLSVHLDVPISRFYPTPAEVRAAREVAA
jgi:transcriptional regulator with XRE-family HTH domain